MIRASLHSFFRSSLERLKKLMHIIATRAGVPYRKTERGGAGAGAGADPFAHDFCTRHAVEHSLILRATKDAEERRTEKNCCERHIQTPQMKLAHNRLYSEPTLHH